MRKEIVEKFTLRELIGEGNWSTIGNPATFGKSFKSAVRNNDIDGVVHVGTDIAKRRDIYRKN